MTSHPPASSRGHRGTPAPRGPSGFALDGALFYGANDAMFLTERLPSGGPGRFTEVNDRACEMLGYSREELLALGPADILGAEDAARLPALVAALEAEGRVALETAHRTRDGRWVPVEVSVGLARFADRTAHLAIVRDISVRRIAERETARRQALLGAALEIAAAFLREPDLPAAARAVLRDAERLTSSRCGFVGARFEGARPRLLALTPTVAQAMGMTAVGDEAGTAGLCAPAMPWFEDLVSVVLQGPGATVIEDLASHPARGLMGAGHPPLRRLLAAPLVAGGEAVGVLCLADKSEPYDEGDRLVVQTLAAALAQFVDHDRLSATLRRRARFAQALQRSGAALLASAGEQEVLDAACDALTGPLEYALAAVASPSPDGAVHPCAVRAPQRGALLDALPAACACWTRCPPFQDALRLGRTQVVPDLGASGADLPCGPALLAGGLRSLIYLPVGQAPQDRAVLLVGAASPRGFPEDIASLIETFAQQIGQTLDALRLRGALLRALDQAEVAARTRSSILAHVTHELRTPLTSVIGFANVLDRQTFGSLTEQQRTWVAHIRASGEHLLELVDQVVELAGRAGAEPQPAPRAMDIVPLIGGCLRDVGFRWPQARLELGFPAAGASIQVRTQEAALRRVLGAVLDNAVKFTPDGGRLDVEIEVAGARVRVLVRDTGCGIAESDLARVLGPFEKAEPGFCRRRDGAGLGLALARHLLAGMDGSLALRSAPGAGTTVTIDLPRWNEEER